MRNLTIIIFFILMTFQLSAQKSEKLNLQPYFSAIIVTNIDSSIQWYSEILGFEILNKTENEAYGFKQANLKSADALLELIELKTALSTSAILKDQPPKTKISGFFKIGFSVKDFDSWISVLSTAGIDVKDNVVNDPNSGKKMVIILDPDGNRIQFFEE